jgi:hypothetical protein
LQLGSAQQESIMKVSWIAVAAVSLAAGLSLAAADPAFARVKHKVARHCGQTAGEPSLYGFFFNPAPRPNGCAPPVYAYGRYVGQDPDPYIRQQLNRDPQTGYWPY